MENDELKKYFCEDIAALCSTGILPIVVHGGGPQIAAMLKKLEIESKFINGLRVTDEKTMQVAQMVLCGSINKEIVGMISNNGATALGLCGLDSGLIKAKQLPDLGLVGEPSTVNTNLLKQLLSLKLVPVIAPVGTNEVGGGSLNINADTAAGAVAEGLKADRLLLLTDVTGVLDKSKVLIPQIKSSTLPSLIADGTISGGMIPKLETATGSVIAGVGAVSIMDGRVRHCILKALSGEEFGTYIVKG
jgi:acetylglutamate kinase